MKKKLALGLAVIITLAPAAFALAEDNTDNNQGSTVHMMGSTTREIDDHEGSTTGEHGTSTMAMPGEHGKKLGILKHFGTTTPPGFQRKEGSSSDEQGNGLHFSLGSILQWIFGQPASTTVGDLQQQLASGTPPQAPKGFFRSLFERLGWFK